MPSNRRNSEGYQPPTWEEYTAQVESAPSLQDIQAIQDDPSLPTWEELAEAAGLEPTTDPPITFDGVELRTDDGTFAPHHVPSESPAFMWDHGSLQTIGSDVHDQPSHKH